MDDVGVNDTGDLRGRPYVALMTPKCTMGFVCPDPCKASIETTSPPAMDPAPSAGSARDNEDFPFWDSGGSVETARASGKGRPAP